MRHPFDRAGASESKGRLLAAPSKSIRLLGRMKKRDVPPRSRQQAFARKIAPAQDELISFVLDDDSREPSFSRSIPVKIGRKHVGAWLKLAPGVARSVV